MEGVKIPCGLLRTPGLLGENGSQPSNGNTRIKTNLEVKFVVLEATVVLASVELSLHLRQEPISAWGSCLG